MIGTPDLLNLFTEPSVAFLYFMSVIVFSYAALFMALGQRMRGPNERGAGRYATASFGVALAWMVLMVGAMAILVTAQPAVTILPPLDRAVNAMVVLLVGWAFLTADQQIRPVAASGRRKSKTVPPARPRSSPAARIITFLTFILALIIIGTYIYTAITWYNLNVSGYNQSLYGIIWSIGTAILAFVLFLALILRFRFTSDTPLKMIFFVLILAGYGYTLFSIDSGTLQGDDSGALRLAFLAAIPVLPIVIYRYVIERLSLSAQEHALQAADSAAQAARSAQSADANAERESVALLKTLGLMLEHELPEDLPQQIVVSVATALKADVAALLTLDDAEYADVLGAYDNVQHKSIAAMAFKRDEQPSLQEAVHTKTQRALTTEHNLNELVDLYTRLDIQKVGPAYIQPLSRDGITVGVVIVALPYTQRLLRENETRLLEAMAPIAARLLSISRAAQRGKIEQEGRALKQIVEGVQPGLPVSAVRSEMQASLEVARSQINDLSARVRDLQIELDYERSRIAELGANDPEGLSITQRMERMATERKQLEAEREKLIQALQEAQAQLASASGDDDQVYTAMFHVLEQERGELQAQKAQLETELNEIRARGQASAPAILREMLTRLSEEKARLAVERDQIKAQLTDVESQLSALGIEGGSAGLASIIVQLTDERSHYKALAERSIQERDTLLSERQRIEGHIANEAQRDAKITAMETELRRLAEDREALLRQRDSLRQERGVTTSDREKWEKFRTRVVAEISGLQSDLNEVIFERNKLMADRNTDAQERNDLVNERDRLLAERTALQTERDQLIARLEGNREMLLRLGADGVGALKTMIDQLTEERSDLEHQLLRSQNKIQTLEESIIELRGKLAHSVPVPPSTTVSASSAEVMLSIAQELRTPMSSIGAYVDLLLGESVGILGALQRQFLQRVKANTDRLASLIEDFVRVTAIDSGQLRLNPENVDMGEIIDDALTATRTQFREKGIILKLAMPESLPHINGDRDALQQIVIQLLSNAYLASPTDGEVTVNASHERKYKIPARNGSKEYVADVIFMSVRDMGGGVPPEEQERVFSRLYRADNPLIQGLGDTGVGLSIARALTEAHGGRIWLESYPGISSTFKLVIPVQGAVQPEKVAHAAS